MNRVLLTGAKGMLAADVIAAAPAGTRLIETDVEELDITDDAAVGACLDAAQPDAVMNCAAYTNVDGAESDRERAFAINETGPANLARACAARRVPLIQISTDFVFSGDGSHELSEDDQPAPRGVYAESKRAGELAIEHAGGHWLIVRTSWLYGLRGRNFPDTILKLAAEKDALKVVNDQTGRPTCTRDLAQALWMLVARAATGYVHFCNSGACTWYDVAVETVRHAKAIGLLPPSKLIALAPCATSAFPRPAPRPAYSAMSTAKYTRLTGLTPRPWQEALREFLEAKQRGCS